VALQLFGSCLAVAVDAFTQRLESHKWVAMPTPVFKQQQQQQAAEDADGGGGGGGSIAEDLSPPYVLMEHLPLAVFTNGALSAMNELRHCALASLRRPMAAVLQAALERAAGALAHYRATRSLSDGELALFKAAVKAHGDVVVPYLSACFVRLFGSSGGAAAAAAGGAAAVAGGGSGIDAAAVGLLLKEALDDSAHMPARV